VPRGHVLKKSIWGEQYERPPYAKASYFRSTIPGRQRSNSLEEMDVKGDGIVLSRRELMKRRLNSFVRFKSLL